MRIHLLALSMASSQQGCKNLGIPPFTIRVAAFWNFLATDHIISHRASTSIKLSVFQCFPAPTLSPGIGWILQVTRPAQLAACHWSLLDKQYIILRAANDPAAAIGFTIMGKSAYYSGYTFKTLLRHYTKRTLTPMWVIDVKLGCQRNCQKGRAV